MRIRLSIAQGNQYPRRLLNQVARVAINCRRTWSSHAAVFLCPKCSCRVEGRKAVTFRIVFHRWLLRLGYRSPCGPWRPVALPRDGRVCTWELGLLSGSEVDPRAKKRHARRLTQTPASSATGSEAPQLTLLTNSSVQRRIFRLKEQRTRNQELGYLISFTASIVP